MKQVALATVIVACVNATVARADDEDQNRRITSLEAEVSALRSALTVQNQNWLTEERAAEIKGLVQDVLADADTRASLLQNGATAGYDNGFFLSSSDGKMATPIDGALRIPAARSC